MAAKIVYHESYGIDVEKKNNKSGKNIVKDKVQQMHMPTKRQLLRSLKPLKISFVTKMMK